MNSEDVVKIAIIVLVIIILGILLVKRFVYFKPSSLMLPSKENYKNIYEGNLHAWYLEGSNKKVILYCHGNGGNISYCQSHIDSLNSLGYSVLIFDYSGFGNSKGVPSESQLYQDVSIFVEYLMRTFDKKNIVLYGFSIGASIASYVARKYNITTLIIESGLPSIKKLIKHKWCFISPLSFMFSEFNTERYLMGFKCNLLVMHSLNDEIIPYQITDVLRSLAKTSIDLKGMHNSNDIPWNKVDEFIKENS